MRRLSHELVDGLELGEGGVAAIVPHDEHAPHEEPAQELQRQQ